MQLDQNNWACDNCNCVTREPINIDGYNYCSNTFCHIGDECPKCESSGGFTYSSVQHEGIIIYNINKGKAE